MTHEEAYQILTKYLQNKNLIKHCMACEAAMGALAVRLIPNNAETWKITGLLHDADYELAQKNGDLSKHGLLLFDLDQTIPEDIQYAIQAHNPMTSIEPKSHMDWAIRCVDQLTGFIVACALITKEKKLSLIDKDFVLKRMKEPAFARGVDRTEIMKCEEKLGIPLPEFVSITLSAMQKISDILGL